MAKTNVYHITQEGKDTVARTLKNVEEVTGNKYTKKDIEANKISGVALVDVELTEEQVEELESIGIVDLQENKEELEMTKAIEQEMVEELVETELANREEEVDIVEEITMDIEEVEELEEDTEEVEEDTEEVEEDTSSDIKEVAPVEEDKEVVEEVIEEDEEIEEPEEDTEDEIEVEDTKEEPTKEVEEDEEPSLDDLLAKLKANNEKIAKENPEKIKTKKRGKTVVLETDEEGNVEYPDKGYFKDEDHIKKYYKQLSNEQLEEWLELEGLEYNPNDHEGINRMRQCMAIREYHFPKENKPAKKSKSKYADYSTEDLLEMALDNDVEVKDSKGNLRILRMYCIMALREAGLIE